MERTFVYRKHLRQPAKFLAVMELFILLVFGAFSAAKISATEDKGDVILVMVLVAITLIVIITLEYVLLYFIMFRRFKKISVTLTPEGIIYNNAKGIITVPYDNIRALRFPSISYVGGWLKIIHTTGNIRLTVVLENVGDMVKLLKGKLDERHMGNVYDRRAMYKFFKTASFSDQSWERVYDKIGFLIIYMLVSLVITVLSCAFMPHAFAKVILTIISVIGPVIPYLVSEIIIGSKLAKGASEQYFLVPQRDKNIENPIYNWAFGIYSIIYLILILISLI